MENRGIRMLKVFLVEDESVIREGFRDKIPWGQYGFELVGEAGDGEMALPMIRKLKPDLLITDIKMPFMDGLSLSEIVKEELPKARIIIISGYDDFEYARQAIKIGIDQYLLKPVTRLALRGVLMELKEKIEQETENRDYQDQYREEVREFEQFPLRPLVSTSFRLDNGFCVFRFYAVLQSPHTSVRRLTAGAAYNIKRAFCRNASISPDRSSNVMHSL